MNKIFKGINSKRGQVSIFIIIAIVFLLITGLLYYFLRPGKQIQDERDKIPEDIQPVYNFLEECLTEEANNAIELIARQGGYFEKTDALPVDQGIVAYGYKDRDNVLVSLGEMENQLEEYIITATTECDLSVFEEFTFNQEEVTSRVSILEDKVLIQINNNLEVVSDDRRISIEKFLLDIDLPLGEQHALAIDVIQLIQLDPETLDISGLSELDYPVNLIPMTLTDIVYSIDNPDLTFMFSANYQPNQPPVLNLPDELRFPDGVATAIQIEAEDPEGDLLIFSDNTAMFEITQDGVILFTPQIQGEFPVMITVEDTFGNQDSDIVRIIIE